jgi:hypothetical protein
VPTRRHEVKGVVTRAEPIHSGEAQPRSQPNETYRPLAHTSGRMDLPHRNLSELRVRSRVDPLRRSHCRYGQGFAPIGYLMALSGLCYLAQGWIIGSSGFSSALQIPTLLGIGLILVWTVWLLIAALRMNTAALPETTSDATS